MLLQTNSYIVPKDKRAEHSRLLRRFRASLAKLGCDSFEVYEQAGSNWTAGEASGRFVQIMRFRDRRHQLAVQAAERTDPVAQAIIAEFCQLINFPYQQQQGLFAVGFYNSALPVAPSRPQAEEAADVHASEVVESNDSVPDETVETAVESAHADSGGEAQVTIEDKWADGIESEELGHDADAGGAHSAEIIEAASGEIGSDELNAEDSVDDDSLDQERPLPDNTDELGALLDAHVNAPSGNGIDRRPLLKDGAFADDAPAGLEALDLADLDLPDDPERSPRASKYMAR